ncbi:hypothetical protein CapIbe_001887 [Capra ibex]
MSLALPELRGAFPGTLLLLGPERGGGPGQGCGSACPGQPRGLAAGGQPASVLRFSLTPRSSLLSVFIVQGRSFC